LTEIYRRGSIVDNKRKKGVDETNQFNPYEAIIMHDFGLRIKISIPPHQHMV
jgi:hypothetical protein